MGHRGLVSVLERLAGLPDLEQSRTRAHRLGLEGVSALLEALGRPDRGLRSVLVGGSKGKGTTVLFLEALLRGAGRRTGAFLSPHLSCIEERFLIGGRPASPDALARVLSEAADRVAPGASFFDALTAGALRLFRNEGLEDAILEVGLGGRLDSTNAVEPSSTVITTLEREHEELLGLGLARIAREKAGILRPDVPLVTGCRGQALSLISAAASKRGAPLFVLGRDFALRRLAPLPQGWRIELRLVGAEPVVVDTPLRPVSHLTSLALAAQAYALLHSFPDISLLATASATALPGRFELLPGQPDWLLDGAHTEGSLLRLARDLGFWFPDRPLHLLFGVAADKRWQRAFRLLAGRAASACAVTLPGSRGVPAQELAAALPGKVRACLDLDEAYSLLIQAAGPAGLAVATGSFKVAGRVRERLLGPGKGSERAS